MTKTRIFVTGGAGYIGSHFIKNAYEKSSLNPHVLTFDNLSTGHKSSLLYGDLVVGDLEDTTLLTKTIQEFKPDVIVHFAASIKVEESMRLPFKYYQNNTANALNLLRIINENAVPYFIFSSTGAVYKPIDEMRMFNENDILGSTNVYGDAKAIVENVLHKSKENINFNYVVFRYFNVAGADPKARIGQISEDMSHLIGRALEVALGKREYLPVYGNDYSTVDGTCIRDYIHIEDLVDAHINAITYLTKGGKSDVFNLGCGRGLSVTEVVESVKRVTGKALPMKIEPRRAGDAPFSVADNKKVLETLNWIPNYPHIDDIVEHAYNFILKFSQK